MGREETCLALAAAGEANSKSGYGIWWVDLSALTGAGLLPSVVANVLRVAQSPGEDPVEAIARALRHKDVLVILDNCEQVIDECAGLVDRLLRDCPDLRVLATSREVMGVSGERVFRVAGLQFSGRRLPR